MKIKLYPDFEDVFIDNTLKGIFYPLCTILHHETPLHFVSSNGLWMDEKHNSQYNCFEYTQFKLENGKYVFEGNLELYKGSKEAKKHFSQLEDDFNINGEKYLNEKMKCETYISHQINKLKIEKTEDFDEEYFLQTFYEFSINKLNYEKTGDHGAFRGIIDDWPNGGTSPIVYTEETEEMEGTLNHFDKPPLTNFDDYELVGKTIGFEFFTDGNDSLLFFNPKTQQAVSINFYS